MSAAFSPDLGTPVADSPFPNAQAAIDAAQTPAEAAENLVTFWITQGVCFTSGHVTHAIREARQDLMFRHGTMGEIVRGLFESGTVPSYDDGLGNPVRPVRVMRDTQRTDTRTPVGTPVYIYGPDEFEVESFEFELFIAEAPMVDDGAGGQTSAATALLQATPRATQGTPGASAIPPVQPSGTVAVAKGKMVPGTPIAVVHADGRLCIPRIALEALAFESQQEIRGGQTMTAAITASKVVVTLNAADVPAGMERFSAGVKPTTDRLRLHLTVPNVSPGDEFDVMVSNTGLTIEIT